MPLVVSLILLFSSTAPAVSAHPFPYSGSGTPDDPYMIENVEGLQAMKENLSACYRLKNDIDASVTKTWNGGQGFEPVGPFSGIFDGDGHKIENLYINRNSDNVGLFSVIGATGVVENVGLENENINGEFRVGGLAGANFGTVSNSYTTGVVSCEEGLGGGLIGSNDGIVDNCFSTSNVVGSNDRVGGLIGGNYGTVENCYSTADNVSGGSCVGGLIGVNYGTVENCYSTADNVSGGSYVGGLIGCTYQSVLNSYTTANVSGTTHVGGLVGWSTGNGYIRRCYAIGSVSGSLNVGGLVGNSSYGGGVYDSYARGDVSGSSNVGGLIGFLQYSTMHRTYSTGAVTGTTNVGGLIGSTPHGPYNAFWDINTSGQATSAGGTGKTTENMKNVRTYTDTTWSTGLTSAWDFKRNPYGDTGNDDVWAIDTVTNDGYPYLSWQPHVLLLSPENGLTTKDNVLTLTWDNVVVPDNFEVWVDNNPDFSSPVVLDNTGDNFYDLPELPDNIYFWRVFAYSGGEVVLISDNWSFIIDTLPPHVPTLTLPGDNHGTDNRMPSFTWTCQDNTSRTDNVSGIENYEIQIATDNGFGSPLVHENVSLSIYTPPDNLDWGTYYWRVKARDKAGNEGGWSENRALKILDFDVTTDPTSLEMMRGGSSDVTVNVVNLHGPGENVYLTGSWVGTAPSGVTASFSPSNGITDFSSTLTFTTTSSADEGTFTYRVTAANSSGEIVRTADVSVSIAAMIFSVDASEKSITLMRTDSATSEITVDFVWGSPKTATLSGAWIGTAPTGVTASFSQTSGTPTFSSTLTFVTSGSASPGSYTYRVTAKSGISRTVSISVVINSSMTLTVATDRDNYVRGQYIRISGTALDPKGSQAAEGTISLSLSCDNWRKSLTAEIGSGTYSVTHFINFDQPVGTWTISATASDNRGNTTANAVTKTVSVSESAVHRFYTVTVLNPPPGIIVYRGDSVQVTVEVKDGNLAVQGAEVLFRTKSGRTVRLTETSAGIYSTVYTVGWDEDVGDWSLTVTGIKDLGGYFRGGSTVNVLEVAPARLSLRLVAPSGSVEAGQTVEVRVRATYPDGTPLEQGALVVRTSGGESLYLTHAGDGEYVGRYTVRDRDVGTWSLQISGVDAHGNSGTATATVTVRPTSIGGYVVQYWWAVACAIAVACAAATPFGIKQSRLHRLRSTTKERQRVEVLKQEAAIEYFVRRKITREAYEKLLHDYDVRLGELHKIEMELKWKLKMK
ncbi:MAG: GLUG motif-containing protein [Candidatus Hadarchaeales archaeon]